MDNDHNDYDKTRQTVVQPFSLFDDRSDKDHDKETMTLMITGSDNNDMQEDM